MLTMPGFSSGKIAEAPMTVGLISISRIEEASPVQMPATIPRSFAPFQKMVQSSAGRFADAAMAKARPSVMETGLAMVKDWVWVWV